jgi:SCY1-like protein 2
MTTIKFLSQKIETEQVRKLQELSSTIGVQTAGEFLSFGGAPGQQAMNGKTSPGGASDTDFESLVFGKKDGGQAAIKDGFDWQTPLADSNRSPVERMGTTSPMSGNKGSSTLSVSATTFSWSTPSSNATSQGPKFASSSSGLSSVNSFATLQPSSSAGKGMPSMASAGFGSTTALRPQQTNRPVSNRDNDSSNTVLDWSTSIMSKPPFPSNINSNTRSNSTPPGNQATGQSFVAIGATSNSNSNNSNILGNIGLGISPQTSGLSKPGGGIQLTNFGMGMSSPSSTTINKPFTTSQSSKAFSNLGGTNMGWGMGSGTNTGGMNMNTNMSMSNMGITMKEDKKGLDKWESLI